MAENVDLGNIFRRILEHFFVFCCPRSDQEVSCSFRLSAEVHSEDNSVL